MKRFFKKAMVSVLSAAMVFGSLGNVGSLKSYASEVVETKEKNQVI